MVAGVLELLFGVLLFLGESGHLALFLVGCFEGDLFVFVCLFLRGYVHVYMCVLMLYLL